MRTLKTRIIAALGAAALSLSLPLSAMASWDNPTNLDALASVKNIFVEASEIAALNDIDLSDIKIVYLEDILSGHDLINVYGLLNGLTTQIGLVNLNNALNDLSIADGADILTFGDVLDSNNIDADDVVSAVLFPDGKLVIFCD